MGRDPVFETDKFFQPALFGPSEFRDLFPGGSIRENCQKSDQYDFYKRVIRHGINPRILYIKKSLTKRLNTAFGGLPVLGVMSERLTVFVYSTIKRFIFAMILVSNLNGISQQKGLRIPVGNSSKVSG
jgi:hypothetical protein